MSNKAYIIGGYDTLGKKDEVWEYSQANNQWTQKKAFPFGKITSASGFSIGSNGYVIGGNVGTSPGSYSNKLYKYDAATDTWTQKADYPGDARSSGTAFVVGTKAYYGLGASAASGTTYNLYTNFYAYDTATNKWGAEIKGFPASGRLDMASGVINNKAYVGLGWKYVSGVTTYYTDWYELKVPGLGVSPVTGKAEIIVYPNPSKGQFHIKSGSLALAGLSYRIYNIAGALIKEGCVPTDGNVDLQNAQAGTYVLTVSSDDGMQQRTLLQIRN